MAVAAPDELAWVAGLLWDGQAGGEAVVGPASPAGFRPLASWGILPSRAHPRILVPLTSGRAAAAALRQDDDAMAVRIRLARAAAAVALRSGGLGWVLHRRGLVLRAGTRTGGQADRPALHAYLADALDEPDLTLAVSLGPPRPNRKPVVQLLRPDGAAVGYAKVGWNDLTRRLVRNEAAVLRRLERARPATFQPPRLLHHGSWQGLDVTVGSPLPQRPWRHGRWRHGRWRHGRVGALPPAAVSREIAALGGIARHRLGTSPYWQGLRARLHAVGDPRTAAVTAALAGELDASAATTELAFGTWHGDWTPQNTLTEPGRLYVWDWERCGDGVPVGFDTVHFHFQAALLRGRQPAAEAAQASLRAARPHLAELGQDPGAADLLLTLYLLERLCRAEEAPASALTGRPDLLGAALLDTLARRRAGQGAGPHLAGQTGPDAAGTPTAGRSTRPPQRTPAWRRR